MPLVRKCVRSARTCIERFLHRRPKTRTQCTLPTLHLGSTYGGWSIAAAGLDQHSIVLSVGVGDDISFDLALIDLFGCTVHAFDPTPRSVEWIRQQKLPSKLIFHPIALADCDGTLSLTPPSNDRHMSYSFNDRARARHDTIVVPAARLTTLGAMAGNEKIAILKMDIEGCEYAVINDLVRHALRPVHILCEFHHGMYGYTVSDTEASIELLGEIGYTLYHISPSGREYSFMNSCYVLGNDCRRGP